MLTDVVTDVFIGTRYLSFSVPVEYCTQLIVDIANSTPRPVTVIHSHFPLSDGIFAVTASSCLIVSMNIRLECSVVASVRRQEIRVKLIGAG